MVILEEYLHHLRILDSEIEDVNDEPAVLVDIQIIVLFLRREVRHKLATKSIMEKRLEISDSSSINADSRNLKKFLEICSSEPESLMNKYLENIESYSFTLPE